MEDDGHTLHRSSQSTLVSNILLLEFDTMPRRGQILFLATSQIVEDHNARNALLDKPVDEITAYKPGAAGDEDLHGIELEAVAQDKNE